MAFSKGKKGKKQIAYVALSGEKFYKLKQWKEKNPGKIYFDSGLERDCYLKLEKSGLNFIYEPESRELAKSFKTLSFSLKTKKMYRATVRNISYTSDFLVLCPDGTRIYIESKGFFHSDSRLRYKLFQNTLKPNEITVLIKSTLDLTRVIDIIKRDFSGANKVTKEIPVKIEL